MLSSPDEPCRVREDEVVDIGVPDGRVSVLVVSVRDQTCMKYGREEQAELEGSGEDCTVLGRHERWEERAAPSSSTDDRLESRPMAPAPTKNDLAAYFDRLAELLAEEDATDQERTSLLATRCSFDELAHRGLAVNGTPFRQSSCRSGDIGLTVAPLLSGLSVSGISLGLGGKRSVICSSSRTDSSSTHSDADALINPVSSRSLGPAPSIPTQSSPRMASGTVIRPRSLLRRRSARRRASRRVRTRRRGRSKESCTR